MVDSGAGMHMVSKKDLKSAELETMRMSRNSATVMTANGEVQTREDATKYVKELDLFVTVMLLEETPAVLSLVKLCEDHEFFYHWTGGQKPTSHQKRKSNQLQYIELRTIRCPWFVNEFLHVIFTNFFNIFIAGFCDWHGKSSSRKKCENECRELRGNRSRGSAATKIKMKDAKEYKAICCMTCRTGCRISEKIWSMK